jgi:hypothetical protein
MTPFYDAIFTYIAPYGDHAYVMCEMQLFEHQTTKQKLNSVAWVSWRILSDVLVLNKYFIAFSFIYICIWHFLIYA